MYKYKLSHKFKQLKEEAEAAQPQSQYKIYCEECYKREIN